MTLKTFLYGLGIVAIILTLIPIIPVDHWWIRMFDFPHIQLTVVTLIALVTFASKFNINEVKEYIFLAALIGCFIYQFITIYPLTPLHDIEVLEATTESPERQLTLFTSNVLQDNDQYDSLNSQIKKFDADIVLLTETDNIWRTHITRELSPEYRYSEEAPLPNTYGMLLYSKLELVNPTIHYRVDDSIPSISSKVVLKTGDTIQFFGIHPTPPMPQENPRSTDRDTEMMLTAKLARESKLPVVVLGDFNDVAWSDTTLLFKNTGELLDVRVGRGFFSTFDATNPILRWPLDHMFISEEFRVNEVTRGEDIKSDHFPFYASLSFEPEKAA
ncbi:MAG: endonuclease/exonuclease/phosphatase family protein, partial [Flavobacteriaceae bacterium]|nr:endonuclease/exonuclease/phosphatase family protein [Flavobacteriaceae bacterium]